MIAPCTQNTDRECRPEDCCLKKPKCEICDDQGSYYVHGIIEVPIKFECECNAKEKS
jgi:hypothetical protein